MLLSPQTTPRLPAPRRKRETLSHPRACHSLPRRSRRDVAFLVRPRGRRVPARKTSHDLADDVVRIHIRANSNGEEDQAVKLAVRDEITAYLDGKLRGCEDKADAVRVLETERENLADIAQTVLYRNGFDYKVRVELKNENFPERVYGDYVFPVGDYDALMIYLGEGAGDNWWCVAFPPLCFLPGDGEDVVYSSWVKELLDRIF